MPGSTTSKRAIVQTEAWSEISEIIKDECISFTELETALKTSRKVLAHAVGGPPRRATKAEKESRQLIEAMAKRIKDPDKRERFRRAVAISKIPPDAWRCFSYLLDAVRGMGTKPKRTAK